MIPLHIYHQFQHNRFVQFRMKYRPAHGYRLGECFVMAWATDSEACVLIIEPDNNPGMSVTNSYEHIASQVATYLEIFPTSTAIRWFESYEYKLREMPAEAGNDNCIIDEVKFLGSITANETVVQYSKPNWHRFTINNFRTYMQERYGVIFDPASINFTKALNP